MIYDIAIQIINFNTKYYLKICLNSLLNDLKNSNINYYINILDNASDDDLTDFEKTYSDDRISFYYSKENLGFAKGHNLLAKKINAKYLLILNPDLKFFESNTIERLCKKILTDQNFKILGPELLTGKMKTQVWDHGEIKGFVAKFLPHIYWQKRKNAIEVSWISGAVLLIEKETYDKVDGFDEHYFLYAEDVDLCLTVRKAGGKIIYDPAIKVIHYGSAAADPALYMRDSMNYFINKYHGNNILLNAIKLVINFVYAPQVIYLWEKLWWQHRVKHTKN